MPPIFNNSYRVKLPDNDIDDDYYLYEFITDNGIEYNVFFTSASFLMPPYSDYKDHVYDMTISNIQNNQFNLRDLRIQPTIAKIIHHFCTTYQFAVSYLCNDTDGKGHLRSRKFNGWFINHGVPLGFKGYITSLASDIIDDQTSYVGIISYPEDYEFDYLLLELRNYYQGEYQKSL